jgi:hypothetical protein
MTFARATDACVCVRWSESVDGTGVLHYEPRGSLPDTKTNLQSDLL